MHTRTTGRATIAREVRRSLQRDQAVRAGLADTDLGPWLTRVDVHYPGLIDTERVRLAQILSRDPDTAAGLAELPDTRRPGAAP